MGLHEITRIEAAELQLEKSIKLFFKKENPFIIHVLSQNAVEIFKSAVQNLGEAPMYEKVVNEFCNIMDATQIKDFKSSFGFKEKSNKIKQNNHIPLATFINNRTRNQLKHSDGNQLHDIVVLDDMQNIVGIMDALMMLKTYKRSIDDTWEFKCNGWYVSFYLFFLNVGQYLIDEEVRKYPISLCVDLFVSDMYANEKGLPPIV